MKKITALILAAVMCIALCACGESAAADAPDGMKKVEVDTKNYTIYVPQSWTVDMSTGTVSAYASATDRSNVSFTAFTVTDRTTTLDSFWESYADDFKSTFGDTMKYIDEKGEESAEPVAAKTTLGGIAANKYVYTARVTGEIYKFMQVTCLAAGSIYILTYTAVDSAFDAHVDDVNRIISEFKFN